MSCWKANIRPTRNPPIKVRMEIILRIFAIWFLGGLSSTRSTIYMVFFFVVVPLVVLWLESLCLFLSIRYCAILYVSFFPYSFSPSKSYITLLRLIWTFFNIIDNSINYFSSYSNDSTARIRAIVNIRILPYSTYIV